MSRTDGCARLGLVRSVWRAKAVSPLRSATAVQKLRQRAATVRDGTWFTLRVLSLYPWNVRKDN